jgi:hypothetical protein
MCKSPSALSHQPSTFSFPIHPTGIAKSNWLEADASSILHAYITNASRYFSLVEVFEEGERVLATRREPVAKHGDRYLTPLVE